MILDKPLSQKNASSASTFDVEKIRRDFPILHQKVHGQALVYLDNAATSQKPIEVIDTVSQYYRFDNANIHRGVHALSERATAAYESAREKVTKFFNANQSEEIIFVRQATEGINLVAQSFVKPMLQTGDEILISHIEHHANIVPWQMICKQTGAKLVVAPVKDDAQIDFEKFKDLVSERTRFIAIAHMSNAFGTIFPVKQIIQLARKASIPILLDGAQAAPHMPVDLRDLDCDFYVISGHKLFAPTGTGILFGKRSHLENMSPYQGGGDMIRSVSFEETLYNDPPFKFEAGTPHIAGIIGLGAAIDYLSRIGMANIANYEKSILQYGTQSLSQVKGLKLIGTAEEKGSIFSFVLDGIHPHDVGTILDREGIAIRTGHHCAQPGIERFGVPATSRASFSFYNTKGEVDALVSAIHKAIEVFR